MDSFRILDIACVLGEDRVSPADLFSDDDGRIQKKTGIPYLNRTKRSAFDLALDAVSGLRGLEEAKDDIKVVVYVTQSPTNHLPNHACILQNRIGLPSESICFDVNQGCSGFVQGLLICLRMLNGQGKGLIVCADTYSHHLDPQDRSTQVLFSDGASATLVESPGNWSVKGVKHLTDGGGAEFLQKPIDPSKYLVMEGASVFQWTRRVLGKQILELLAESGLSADDVSLFLLHQASKLVLDNVKKGLGVGDDRVPTTLSLTGNLVSSSIPFLIMNNMKEIENSSRVLMAGYGVGLSSSCCLLENSAN